MNSSVLIIRHGQVDSPIGPNGPLMYGSEQPLNTQGEKQIKKLGEVLNIHHVTPTVIYTSPFPRAIKSAQLLHDELSNHPEVIVRENLKGGFSPQWEGRSISELENVKEDIFSKNPYQPDVQGETLQEAYTRVTEEYQHILETNPNAAIVTHGEIVGIIKHFEKTGDKNKAGLDQPIGKAEALLIQRNAEGKIIHQQLLSPELQPTHIESKK